MTEKVILFKLSSKDLKLADEISLAGVIAFKISKGDYVDSPEWAELQGSYESCHLVNALLHKKLNRIRAALSAEENITESPEDEVDE